MPYYFECTYCNRRIPTDLFGPELDRNCKGCGEDMCVKCCDDGLCSKCRDLEDDLDKAR